MSAHLGRFKVVMQTNAKNSATVIFLHGSGDTGPGVCEWVENLIGSFAQPHIKFIFPTAPVRKYTPWGGEPGNVWFDRQSVQLHVPEDAKTLQEIGSVMNSLIEDEVNSGVPLNNIIVGGFSMGGGLALNVGYRFRPGLKGVFALSSFLNDNSDVYSTLQTLPVATPLLMFHGDRDNVVPFEWGQATFDKLVSCGVNGQFLHLPNTYHELKKKELEHVFKWIETLLPN